MYDYYRDNMSTMPVQNQFNPMTAMPVQNQYNPMMAAPMQGNPMGAMPVQGQYNPMMAAPMQGNPMGVMPMQGQPNMMGAMPMQTHANPMETMSEQQLENMYPKTYHIIKPAVENACEKMAGKKGHMHVPTQEEMESMITEVYDNVQADVEANVAKAAGTAERQFYGGGRRLLRDFIGALLITSLIGRRRPFYPGFYGGYGYPYFY